MLTLFCAHYLGGNGFIATFVGSFCSRRAGSLTSFVDEEGQLFSLAIFFIFGAALFPAAIANFTPVCIAYAILSLTVIRILPIWISLVGLKLKPATCLFLGWFGPRGLASILFLLIAVEHEEMGRLSDIEAVVYITVFLSVILHGATSAPFSRIYARSAAAKSDG